jgi:hypothetical protein
MKRTLITAMMLTALPPRAFAGGGGEQGTTASPRQAGCYHHEPWDAPFQEHPYSNRRPMAVIGLQ